MKKTYIVSWLSAVAIITVVMLLIYATVQQNYRNGLNDPQLQMVRDARINLEKGISFHELTGNDTIDLKRSLSTFFVLYNAGGTAIASNGLLNGKLPQVPRGVFGVVDDAGEYRVSWQPEQLVRMAMVIIRLPGTPVKYLAAGRSMLEVEERIASMRMMIFIAWVVCLCILLLGAFVFYVFQKKN